MNKFVMDIKGFTVVGEDVYFCTYRANGVFKLNIPTNKVEYITMTEKIVPTATNLYADMKLIGTKLWFAPCFSADDILIYDIFSKKYQYISFPMTEHDKQNDRFGGLYEYKDWIVFTPLWYPAIIKVHKKSYEMKLVSWEEPLLKRFPDFAEVNQEVFIYYDFEVVGAVLYLLANNVVIKYNMETDEISFVKICGEARNYRGIACFNDAFLLVDGLCSEVVCWNEKDGNVYKIDVDLGFSGEMLQDPGYPLGICRADKQIVVMQQCADYLLLINSEWEVCKVPLKLGEYKRTDVKFQQYKLIGNKLYMPLFGKNAILIVDTSDWSQEIVEFDLSQLDLSEAHKRIEKEIQVINEGILFYQLENLIQYANER